MALCIRESSLVVMACICWNLPEQGLYTTHFKSKRMITLCTVKPSKICQKHVTDGFILQNLKCNDYDQFILKSGSHIQHQLTTQFHRGSKHLFMQ